MWMWIAMIYTIFHPFSFFWQELADFEKMSDEPKLSVEGRQTINNNTQLNENQSSKFYKIFVCCLQT